MATVVTLLDQLRATSAAEAGPRFIRDPLTGRLRPA